VTWYC